MAASPHVARGLRVSDTLSLPHEAVTETFAVVGKRGTGKTNFGVVLAEELIAAGLPTAIIDPVGVWYGLRLDGKDRRKSSGLDVVIFGGQHGDVPLEHTAGAVIADVVADSRRACILDLSLMRKGQQIHFMTDLSERLYYLKATNHDPLQLIIDEADAFAPQQGGGRGGDIPPLLGAMEDLARRGRARGIGLTLITQRPAVLNKNVLTQAEVLVVFKLTGPQDRKAIDDWVRGNADDAKQVAAVQAALPGLPRGDAFVWSPGWLNIFERVHIRQRRTWDSSATPKPGERSSSHAMPPIDLEDIKKRVAATIERAKNEDPKTLRARIAELERDLASKPAAEPIERVVEREVVKLKVPDELLDAVPRLKTLCARIEEEIDRIAALAGDARRLEFVSEPPPAVAKAPERSPSSTTRTRPEPKVDRGKESGPRRILIALAQLGPLPVKRLAIVTGYQARGGGFGKHIADLKSEQAIEKTGDRVSITARGREALGSFEPLPRGRALLDYWLAHIGDAPARRLLDELAAVHPRKLTVTALAQRTGYVARGGGFTKPLARLRAFGLIAGRGELGLSRELADAIGT